MQVAAMEGESPLLDGFEVTVLGSVGVRIDGEQVKMGPRLRRLLAGLVVADGDVVSVDRLADIVWEGSPPRGADRTLKSYVTRLRQALSAGTDAIEFRAPGYLMTVTDHLDSRVFEHDLDEGLLQQRRADHQAAGVALSAAVGRWTGRAYAEFADEEWARPEAVRLEERLLEAREAQIDVLVATGADEQAVAAATALAESEPLRERPRALMMTALYAAGRQAEALRHFRSYAHLLAEETGLTPSSELSELEGRILRGEPAAEQSPSMLRGYRVGERIGEGAFSVVHAGVQPGLDRPVAIKIIRGELADAPEFIRRFEFEARTVGRLEHPHVVPLYDYWREPGAGFLVMRLMRGGSVEQMLRRQGPYSAAQVVKLVDDVGGALTAAHRAGIVHRDVRPANLLLDTDGETYLADFGIAISASTQDGASMLQPDYAAPEVLRGQPATATADVLSLGVTVFELLTGRLPFADSDDHVELVRRQMDEPLPPVTATRSDLPTAVDDVLARSTAKAPDDRYPTIAAMTADLTAALGSSPSVQLGRQMTTRRVSSTVANPYVGLHAFDEADEDRFAGRESLVAEIVETLERSSLVTVVGPSGSGKSSAVRAGVLPALRRGAVAGSDRWFVATMMPGDDPVGALETALLRIAVNPPTSLRQQLAQPGGMLRAIRRILPDDRAELLLIIDQFEELFSQSADEAERDRFLNELAMAISAVDSPLRVVATIRADHYDAPLRHAAMAPLVSSGVVSVTPMTPDELERAISAPARAVDVQVDPSLLAMLVAEMSANSSALPLMQFALTEVFDQRTADVMLQSTYQELGGLTGALAARADRIVDTSDPKDEVEVRRLFSRLVTLGDGGADARRRALRSDLGGDDRTAWLLDSLVSARLLTSDADEATRQPTIEIAHEALLREWPRLRAWIDEDRSDLAVLQSIGRTATEWAGRGRDNGGLARAARLAMATDLVARHGDWLSPIECEWFEASVAAAEAENVERLRRADRDRRQNHRLRRLLLVAACLLVVASLAAATALVLRSRANRSERDADIERLVAVSAAQIATAPDRAILLALEAYRQRPDAVTAGAVQRAIATEPRLVAHRRPTLGDGARTIMSADGNVAVEHVIRGDQTEFAFVDTDSNELLGQPVVLGVRSDFVAVSGDGSVAVAGVLDDGTLNVVRTGGEPAVKIAVGRPGSVALDREGTTMVVDDFPIDGEPSIVVIDVATGATISERTIDDDPLVSIDLHGMSPDGTRYAVSTYSNIQAVIRPSTVILDAATGSDITTLTSEHGEPFAVAWSPTNGFALGYSDGTVEVFDPDGVSIRVLTGHSDPVGHLAIGPDGAVAAAAVDGSVRQWDPTGAASGPIAFGSAATSLASTADGRFQLAFSDGTRSILGPSPAALYDLTRDGEFSAVDARSPYNIQPRIDFTGLVMRRLDDDTLAGDVGFLTDLPNGAGTPPFISIDGEWMLAFDAGQSRPLGLVYDVTGATRIPFTMAEVDIATDTSSNDPGSMRVSAGGDRLITLGYTRSGQARVTALALPDLSVVAGPLDIAGGAGRLLELMNGDVLVAGGSPDGTSGSQGLAQLLDGDLADAPRQIPGSIGLVPLHQSDEGEVLLGDNDGRVALLDPDTLELRFLEDVDGPAIEGAISPDGRTVAVVLKEAGVQLLDTEDGGRIGIPMPGVPYTQQGWPGVRWSDDSEHFWAGTGGPVHRFLASADGWVERACDIAGRELTEEEWRTYVSDDGDRRSICGG
jgi:serine/threonine protein kinase/DNA-binding SARP family transcriptional activator/WD40 repeat protein